MREPYDRGSKWLIGHHGNSLLYLGGISTIRTWRAVQTDLVQPRRLPDGLIEAFLADRTEPDLFLVEISTYPERRLNEQMLRDAMLVYLDRGVMPELLTVVLQPRGNVRITGTHTLESRLGWMRIQFTWRVVEIWTLSAEALFAANDVGLIPWIALTQFDGPPEVMLQRCRERIDQQSLPKEHENLLAVTQVLAGLRYNNNLLLSILGGKQAMIESPVLQELMAQRAHRMILKLLEGRFGQVPPEITLLLRDVQDDEKLDTLGLFAAQCPSLDAFRARLTS